MQSQISQSEFTPLFKGPCQAEAPPSTAQSEVVRKERSKGAFLGFSTSPSSKKAISTDSPSTPSLKDAIASEPRRGFCPGVVLSRCAIFRISLGPFGLRPRPFPLLSREAVSGSPNQVREVSFSPLGFDFIVQLLAGEEGG